MTLPPEGARSERPRTEAFTAQEELSQREWARRSPGSTSAVLIPELDAERAAHDATLAAFAWSQNMASGGEVASLLAKLAEAERERDEANAAAAIAYRDQQRGIAAEYRLREVRPLVRWALGVWDWLWVDLACVDSEDGWALAEKAAACGLAQRVDYDPRVHGETAEAEPGDSILYPSDIPSATREWALGSDPSESGGERAAT